MENTIFNKVAPVNGIRLYYQISGSGSPLLLLHGAPQTSYAWRKVMPALTETYTVIAPDLRGYGESEKPPSGYEVHTMAEDIRQLLSSLELEKVNVIGHDLGGIVGYVYAAQHPDNVRRLGIIEAPIPGVPSATMESVLAQYWHFGLYAHPRLPELLISGREQEYLAEFIGTYQSNSDAFEDRDFAEYARHLASPGGIGGSVGVYRAILSELPAISKLTRTKLTMPVWAVGGEHSMGLGPLEQFRHLAEDVRGGVISGSGHWVIEEQPGQTVDALREFLS